MWACHSTYLCVYVCVCVCIQAHIKSVYFSCLLIMVKNKDYKGSSPVASLAMDDFTG